MNFHHPSFLWAFLLLAVPVIIHLFNFRKYKKVIFSNVDMLKEIQTESRKTRQIKKWLVLLSRMLVISALVLAFSRPYIPSDTSTSGRHLVSIYLDNSQSMNGEGEKGQLFESAKNSIRDLVNSLPHNAEIQVIDNELSTFSGRIQSPQNAIKVIDDMEISHKSNSLTRAVQKSNSVFVSEGFNSGHLFAYSDFQVDHKEEASEVDSALQLNLIRMEPKALQNLSIDSVWLSEPVSRPDEPVELKVRIINNGNEDVSSSTFSLAINGIQQTVESFGVAARSEVILEVAFTSNEKGWVSGECSISDVPVVFDNTFYFTVHIKESIRILQIGNPSVDLKKLYSRDKTFIYSSLPAGSVDYGSLSENDFIILNELTDVSSGLSQQLRQFVENGGVLAILPNSAEIHYDGLVNSLNLVQYGSIQLKNLSIMPDDLNHPFIKDVYKKIPKSTLLPKVTKCYILGNGSETESVLRLKDGSNFMTKSTFGVGSVFQFSVPLESEFSNWKDHELFVLTMLKMAFSKSVKQHIASSLFSTGSIASSSKINTEIGLTLVKEPIAVRVESAQSLGAARFWLNDEVREAGVYALSNGENTITEKVALNYPRAESVQNFATDEELEQQFQGGKVEVMSGEVADIKSVTSTMMSGTALWKLFLVLCLIFLLIEILLLRLLKS